MGRRRVCFGAVFNRNQGNLRRAGLNVAQAQTQSALERKVISEVRQAATDLRAANKLRFPA